MLYKRVVIFARDIVGIRETLEALIEHLSKLPVTTFYAQSNTDLFAHTNLKPIADDALAGEVDMIIVVGGDGSLLNAAHAAAPQDIPLVGINRGRLGFLTDIHPDSLSQLDDILAGEHTIEYRHLIQSQIKDANGESPCEIALNDVVVLPSQMAQMIAFDMFVDDQLVYEHRADGLIIATPTGSTAYALSGGGPILQPQIPVLSIVPMFPHTLSSRPIVVSVKSTIRVKISENQFKPPFLSNDGQERKPIQPGGEVIVSLYDKKLKLLHHQNYNYYKTLREKLNWEQSARRPSD